MRALCPRCDYDLEGHDGTRVHRCPECGLEIALATVWNAQARLGRRRRLLWRLFFLSPVMALPVVALAMPAYLLICFALSAPLAYAAIRTQAPDAERYATELRACSKAVLAATALTGVASLVLIAFTLR